MIPQKNFHLMAHSSPRGTGRFIAWLLSSSYLTCFLIQIEFFNLTPLRHDSPYSRSTGIKSTLYSISSHAEIPNGRAIRPARV
jgi:hypothetical protein